jgi:regulator of RNase E activity RraA
MVEPGDLLHGDRNGVTTIPVDIASEIPDASREFMEGEAFILDYVRGPNPTAKGLSEAHKACRAKFAEISQRVSRKK